MRYCFHNWLYYMEEKKEYFGSDLDRLKFKSEIFPLDAHRAKSQINVLLLTWKNRVAMLWIVYRTMRKGLQVDYKSWKQPLDESWKETGSLSDVTTRNWNFQPPEWTSKRILNSRWVHSLINILTTVSEILRRAPDKPCLDSWTTQNCGIKCVLNLWQWVTQQ